MLLPQTYYDVLRRRRPRFAANADRDAQDLARAGRSFPINDLTEVPNRHEEAFQYSLNELVAHTASISGVSIAEIRKAFATEPEAQQELDRFLRPLAMDYYALLNFALFGKKAFYLHDGLVQRLAATEMNVACPLLQLPFPACMFVLTSSDAIDALYRIEHPTQDGPFLVRDIDYDAPVTVFLMMMPSSSSLDPRRLGIIATHANDEHTYIVVQRNLLLVDEWNLEQALATDWQQLYNLPTGPGPGARIANSASDRDGPEWKPVSDELFFNQGLLFFRLLLNAALYISSADAQMQPGSSVDAGTAATSQRRGTKSASQERPSALSFISVGAKLPLLPFDDSGAVPDANKRGLSVRFQVRGHWRHQACGPNFQHRVLKYIQPYEKGPEMADLINKPYLVK